MSIQFPRGTAAANDAYTGPNGAISVDFTNELIRVHDGTTAGGIFSVGASGGGGTISDLSVNYATASFTIVNTGGTDATVNAATTTTAGAMSASDKTKLDGVEAGATADQTATEIKTAYESNANTNAFTDAEQTKLTGIETGAEVNDAFASTVEATTGTSTTVMMSPLRTREFVESGNFTIDFGTL